MLLPVKCFNRGRNASSKRVAEDDEVEDDSGVKSKQSKGKGKATQQDTYVWSLF